MRKGQSAAGLLTFLVAISAASSAQAQSDETAAKPYPRDPVVVDFSGGHALGVAAVRQRILSYKLGYIITVDANGKPTDCEVTRDFRKRATEIALCRPFLKHLKLEPALDDEGNPVEGTYSFDLNFNMFMTEEGDIEQRFR